MPKAVQAERGALTRGFPDVMGWIGYLLIEAIRRAMNSCSLGSLLAPINDALRAASDAIAGSMPNQIMQVRFGSICCSGCAARPEAMSQRSPSGRGCVGAGVYRRT